VLRMLNQWVPLVEMPTLTVFVRRGNHGNLGLSGR
jgi:hypothetical protein